MEDKDNDVQTSLQKLSPLPKKQPTFAEFTLCKVNVLPKLYISVVVSVKGAKK